MNSSSPRVVTTAMAAQAAGKSVRAFRVWARRHAVSPAARVRVGRSTHSLWDVEDVLDAITPPVTPYDWAGQNPSGGEDDRRPAS